MTSLRMISRLLVIAAIAAATVASTSSTQTTQQPTTPNNYGSPAPQQMDPSQALGLWKSSFGPVKIEVDDQHPAGALMGVWTYDKQGQQVVGFFSGALSGNVLNFNWQEPGPPDLVGEGYLVFDPYGKSFSGKWWTTARDRGGDWNGWRATPAPAGAAPTTVPATGAEPAPQPAPVPAEPAPVRRNDGVPPPSAPGGENI